MKTLILGARPSKMAVAVANKAKMLLQQAHPEARIEIKTFKSEGDIHQGDLRLLGGKGAFIKNLEERLLNKEIDCAIHALKDIPGDCLPHPDLHVFSYLAREEARDALIVREGLSLEDLLARPSFVLGTSSPRRRAILKRLYPNAVIKPLRGNADSRIAKLQAGEFDAIILSYAGLKYIDQAHLATKIYEPHEMLPAVGQGVLVLQVRKEDAQKCGYLKDVNSNTTEILMMAERSMLHTLQGNCYSAIAGHARLLETGELELTGMVADLDGKTFLMARHVDTDLSNAADLGVRVAQDLFDQGARELMDKDAA